jgi:hypothetical protein
MKVGIKAVILSWIFMFPPFHEVGHVIIITLCGGKVVRMQWNCVWQLAELVTPMNRLLNDLWEYSVFMPLIVLTIFVIYKHREE